ncbi:ribosomal protein S5 domain 2-type protein [Phascolomyces articulosus]|uniref:Ribosomal protein S5 domain 2-type protein n=1 Tax=Phascolomyces articulosus TaxID=60185 RepID=A0AAD5JXF9_9FUNG|nr:ribosomal protein S5 domain 2-type protein [Phascolomyces articulosus]
MDTLVLLASTLSPSRLENEIKNGYTARLLQWHDLPRSLLSISGRPALSWWYDAAKTVFKNVYIVANAYNYKHYERWASGHDFPTNHILNCGISVLSDIAFVHRVKKCNEGAMIMTADFLYDSDQDSWFLDLVTDLSTKQTNQLFTYGDKQTHLLCTMGHDILESLASLPQTSTLYDALNIDDNKQQVVKVQQPSTHLYMDDSLSLDNFLSTWLDYFEKRREGSCLAKTDVLQVKAYARVGLMGNPSDGFYGKTISMLISNFWAQVTLIPHNKSESEYGNITIMSNPVADPRRFSTMSSLANLIQTDGYENGDRLLLACCKVFYCYCNEAGINIDTQQGFKLLFDTNIPRQVGLAGSSAIITACWKALLKFYHVTNEQIPLEKQASLVLSVETDELGIAAGLQDRVIQAYGGLVYMDFDQQFVEEHGYGKYERLDSSLVPPLFLAYVARPEDSGKVHSTVKQRFLQNDPEVIEAMKQFASFTVQARESLERGDHHAFAQMMTSNFEQRRKTYGDAVVGAANLRMVDLARQHGCVAKFPGSGGAVVGMWDGSDETTRSQDLLKLRHALESEGYVFVELTPMGDQA